MIEDHFVDWFELLVRWIHLIVGIAWIGASFYFNWLENRLERENQEDPRFAGDLWAIHGGGFYHVKKIAVAPDKLPSPLHWFKWEAYATLWTGILLLAMIYYYDAQFYLIEPANADLSVLEATTIGIATIAISWFFYDLLCKSALIGRQNWLAFVVFIYFSIVSIVLCSIFSGRGAFIHVGAAIGTIMVLNVFAVIIPSQRALVNAVETGQEPDPKLGEAALLRSRHNNYLTLPVLFIMISNHYPVQFGHKYNWAILILLGLLGVLVRHYFNVRHLAGKKSWLLVIAGSGFLLLAILTLPTLWKSSINSNSVNFDMVQQIVHERCTVCHSASPVQPGFTAAAAGLQLDTKEQIQMHAPRIYSVTTVAKSMPPGNISQMTEEERVSIGVWYRTHYLAKLSN